MRLDHFQIVVHCSLSSDLRAVSTAFHRTYKRCMTMAPTLQPPLLLATFRCHENFSPTPFVHFETFMFCIVHHDMSYISLVCLERVPRGLV